MINKEKDIARMKFLVNLLNEWNHNYYNLNNSLVEDQIYDGSIKELKKLEKKWNFILPDSPNTKIGFDISNDNLNLIERNHPMLSLESVNNEEDLSKWGKKINKALKINEIEYLCEWKIDGLSVSLIYKDNKLEVISTRGNGLIGENVTFNKNIIKNIPLILKNYNEIGELEIRGEVYMKKEDFSILNKNLESKGLKKLSNPRNAASGTLRSLFPSQERNLYFFAYQIFKKGVNNQFNCLKLLEKLNFSVNKDYKLINNFEEIKDFIKKKEKERNNLNFESDGIVIKVNDYQYHNIIGQNNKFPRWAIAYKFPHFSAITRIIDISIQVSRSGRITYVANIIPAYIQGIIINKVTLHNYSYIKKFSINKGDKVIIKRSGDVIPQISEVIKEKEGKIWDPPKNCPSCNSILSWNNNNVYQLCLNNNCSQKIISLINHFCSKNGLDIKGVSFKRIKKLYENDFLKNPIDLYYLSKNKEKILNLEGFNEKNFNNIINSIENSKKKPLHDLISALGIPLLSSIKAKKLIVYFPNLNIFIKEIIEKNEWEKIEIILGKESKKEIESFFKITHNKEIILKLKSIFF